MRTFNYQHLYYFYASAQKRSFSEAARSLHISQPALSMQLKQFEEHWGFALFYRRKEGIALTEEGSVLFDYAKAIFDLGDEAEETLLGKNARKAAAVLRIGVSAAVPKAVVNSLFRFLYRGSPGIHLVLRQDRIEGMIEALTKYKLDLVVNDAAYQTEAAEGVENHLAAEIPMVFYAARRLARKYKNLPEDLHEAPLILPTAPDQTYHAMQNYIHTRGIKPKIAAEVEDLELMRFLVAESKGIGLLNSYAVRHSPERSRLAALKEHSQFRIHDTIYLIKRQRKIPHPLVEHVLKNFRLDKPA